MHYKSYKLPYFLLRFFNKTFLLLGLDKCNTKNI